MDNKVKFRGICGAVRRAMHNGSLIGEITPGIVRTLLPDEKKTAPDHVVITSLKRLADLNEIVENKNRFFTKMIVSVTTHPQVSVIGSLLSIKVVDGKSIVTIEAVDMENL